MLPEPLPPPVLAEAPSASAAPSEPDLQPELDPEPSIVPPGILSQIYTPNPWLGLVPGRLPYFAPVDLAVLERHQERASDGTRFDGGVPPLPFLGNPQAPVLLLDDVPALPVSLKQDPASLNWGERWTANLLHAPLRYPLFLVDPVMGQQFGSGSLARSLAYWLAVYGAERVSRSFFQVHLCPYTSPGRALPAEPLPSQTYSLELARTKVRSGCLTLLLGGAERWETLIPELKLTGHRVLRSGVRSLAPPREGRRGNLAPATAEALHHALASAADPV